MIKEWGSKRWWKQCQGISELSFILNPGDGVATLRVGTASNEWEDQKRVGLEKCALDTWKGMRRERRKEELGRKREVSVVRCDKAVDRFRIPRSLSVRDGVWVIKCALCREIEQAYRSEWAVFESLNSFDFWNRVEQFILNGYFTFQNSKFMIRLLNCC